MRYWTEHFGVSEAELRKAVADGGVLAEAVADHLGNSGMSDLSDLPFEYKQCHFALGVVADDMALFLPHVRYDKGTEGMERVLLPVDTAPYGSAAEAWRHAEQQAVRWVHDRTGDGQGRF